MRHLLLIALALLLASPALAQSNTYGYSLSTGASSFVAVPGTATDLGLTDEGAASVALPWAFPFYDGTYSSVLVGANGGLAFESTAISGINNCGASSTPNLNVPEVAVLWDDLDPSAVVLFGGIYAWHDTAADRFIVTWDAIPPWSSLGFPLSSYTFQAHLYPTGDIEFHYDALTGFDAAHDDAASATISIQNVSSALFRDPLEFSCNTAQTSLEGTFVKFQFPCTDADGDGFCSQDDCDDNATSINPDGVEICDDGIDQDCSNGDLLADLDADGYDSVLCGGDDCSPGNANVHPGIDADSDGYDACVDCADSIPSVNPGAPEVCGDLIDNDCDGADTVADSDGDGVDGIACGGLDCDDLDANVNPGIDADADGEHSCLDCDDNDASVTSTTDIDGDGFTACEDCDDDDNTSFPGNAEDCDGVDDDCDGSLGFDADGDGEDGTDCGGADCADDDNTTFPGAPELCDGHDSDCDGLSDGQDFDTGTGVPPNGLFTDAPALALPDTATTTSDITVSTAAAALLDLNVHLQIPHTFPGDLDISLISPAGTTVVLIENLFGSGTGFLGTILDDEAAAGIGLGTDPFTGDWQPSNPLSAFDGEDPNGDWTLSITDTAGGDTGTLSEWSLEFEFNSPDDVDLDGWVSSCAAFGDCDDNASDVYPGAPEICNDGLDQDCDAIDQTGDEDGDGYVDADCGGDDCDDSDAAISPAVDGDADGSNYCEDCDDSDPAVSPTTPEICADGIDQDCSGSDDSGDGDGDGYVNVVCAGGDDCDDSNEFINPGIDGDNDGWSICDDCNDSSPLQNPDQAEICADFLDNDCDGSVDAVDADADGEDSEACGGPDCDDDDPSITSATDGDGDGDPFCDDCDDEDTAVGPSAPEVCDDGTDQDCDGADLAGDVDGDGAINADCGGDDCDDEDPAFNPGATDICDGVDLNCDGATTTTDEDGDGHFDAACGGEDCDDTMTSVRPDASEVCDGLDNNCDGVFLDEFGEADVDGDTWNTCDGDCDDDDETVNPDAVESCNNIDDNCNGEIDDGIIPDADGDGHAKDSCGGADCDDSDRDTNPDATEDCLDEADNDCDGLVDADDEDCDFGTGCGNCSQGGARPSPLFALLLLPLLGRRRR